MWYIVALSCENKIKYEREGCGIKKNNNLNSGKQLKKKKVRYIKKII